MNIFTVPYGSKGFYVKPDTSLNKDSNDYFCPDCINELAAAVFIYARATKAGKSVSAKFAQRYYTHIGKGVHFHIPELINPANPESWWVARSLDNTTFLTEDPQELSLIPDEYKALIDQAFETASKHISFRTGDYIAVEIAPSEKINADTQMYTCNNKSINLIW